MKEHCNEEWAKVPPEASESHKENFKVLLLVLKGTEIWGVFSFCTLLQHFGLVWLKEKKEGHHEMMEYVMCCSFEVN